MPGAPLCNQITHHNNSAYKEHIVLIFERVPVRNLEGYPECFLKKIDSPTYDKRTKRCLTRMPHLMASLLHISRTVWARIIKIYRRPNCPTFTPDKTSRTTSSRKVQRKNRRNVAWVGFRWNFSWKVYEKITKFHTFVSGNWSHKTARYDVASRFWSAVKCNWILDKIYE